LLYIYHAILNIAVICTMKSKNIPITIFFNLIFLCNTTLSVSQTIPNSSFENWSQQSIGTQTVQTADSWIGSYTQGSTPLSPIQSTDHVDGNYGIEIETTQWPIVGISGGMVASIFPITSKPLYINGYFKSLRVDTTGTGQVVLHVKNNGTIIGKALFGTNINTNTYTPFSVPINYTSSLIPDEATIWLSSEGVFGVNTKNFGNKLWIDNLSFSNEPLSISANTKQDKAIFIYPNPSMDVVIITLLNSSNALLQITNNLGQQVMTLQLNNAKNSINISHLKQGLYNVQLKIGADIIVSQLIKH
jgi:hypothetical protein